LKTIVVGAGINGVTSAIELRQRGHEVLLIDPGPVPHPLAASTDISKAVRAAYGPDEDYAELADRSIQIWRQWNNELPEKFFHEVGFLFLRHRRMQPGDFEYDSFKLLQKRGHRVERVNVAEMRKRFPAWAGGNYEDGFVDLEGGYVESGRVVAALISKARSVGVELREETSFAGLDDGENRIRGIILRDGTRVAADTVVMAVGAWTPYLLPSTKPFFRATGHAVFHLQPDDPSLFAGERFPVFADDISSTGYYGFPINRDGVVKVANHGPGREMSPDSPERVVRPEDEQSLRAFLEEELPVLAQAPIVHTRVCMYCDTHDGDFWIAPDPERPGLIVATGDSGHGFKFAPVLGEIIADAVEGKPNPLLQKFRWRPEIRPGQRKEAARFQPK
jgi:glycine/D-amino acid oxidase-like deaminating enzyme